MISQQIRFCIHLLFPYNDPMKQLLFLLAFLLVSQAFSQVSYVAPTRVLRKQGYQLQLSGEVFNTSKLVDKDGQELSLPDGYKFQRYQGEFSGQYGATDKLQLGLGARFRYNKSTSPNVLGEEETTSSTGIQSTFADFKYAFSPVGQLQYSLEGLFLFTPYSNEERQAGGAGDLILGDDGNEYSAGLGVTYSFRSNDFLTLRGGYRKPGKDLSPELYWQAEGALVWKHVALVAGVNGVSSMNSDPHGNEVTGQPDFNTGSTALYNSINREWVAPYAGLNFALGKNWRVELRGSQVVSGRSTDLGTAFGLQLSRRVEKVQNTIDSKFKAYDVEASVTKVSPKKKFVVVDKGIAGDVRKGMVMDFYEYDYVGGNVLVARGTVVQAKAESAIVKITHRYNPKKELKEGLVGRASLR